MSKSTSRKKAAKFLRRFWGHPKVKANTGKLLPCPFCGRAPETAERMHHGVGGDRIFYIFCHCGGYSSRAHQLGYSLAEVWAKWNTRWIQDQKTP